MRYGQVERVVETGGVQETRDFTIKANAKAFRILLDGLYSDKIGSIVREICTNAFDAHLMKGNVNQPFVVHGPTRFEPHFAVRDYGISMDHETVMSLYSTVFESTKDSANDAVGCFGLGSKSPFAYTDEFTVTCFKDGMKRLYGAVIGPNGTPSISLMMPALPTDEPDGVEVRFAVDTGDIYAFFDRIRKVAAGFDPCFESNVSGLNRVTVKDRYGSILVTDLSGYCNAHVRQGCVLYPLTHPDKIIEHIQDAGIRAPARALINNTSVVIDCPIGEVEIAANREEIAYTKFTLENIARRLSDSVDPIREKLRSEFQGVTGRIEAARKVADLKSTSPLRNLFNHFWAVETWPQDLALAADLGGSWRLNEVHNLRVNPQDFTHLEVIHNGWASGNKTFAYRPKRYGTYAFTVDIIKKVGVVVIDEAVKVLRLEPRLFAWHAKNNFSDIIVIRVPVHAVRDDLPDPLKAEMATRRPAAEAELKALLKELSLFTIVKAEDLEAPELEKRSREFMARQWDRYSGKWNTFVSVPDTDVTDTFYYVPLSNMLPLFRDKVIPLDMTKVFEALKAFGCALQATQVYGINKSDLPKIRKRGNFKNLLEDVIVPHLDVERMKAMEAARITTQAFDERGFLARQIWDSDELYAALQGTAIAPAVAAFLASRHEPVDFLQHAAQRHLNELWNACLRIAEMIREEDPESNYTRRFARHGELIAAERAIIARYPLLPALSAVGRHCREIVDYLAAVDLRTKALPMVVSHSDYQLAA